MTSPPSDYAPQTTLPTIQTAATQAEQQLGFVSTGQTCCLQAAVRMAAVRGTAGALLCGDAPGSGRHHIPPERLSLDTQSSS